MRLKQYIAAVALAGAGAMAAAAGPVPGDAPATAPDSPQAPPRLPEINVTVAPPRVAVEVDSPAVHIGRQGDWAVRTDRLPALKKQLDKGQWRGVLDFVEGPLRARFSRDPAAGFRILAQSAPQPLKGNQPGKLNPEDVPNQLDSGDDQQRLLNLYRAQLGDQVKLQKGAFLGVSTSQVPDALRQHLGLREGVGLVVELVEKDSPAEKAGLKKYDILNKLDDQILINGQQLAVLIRTHKAGDTVKLNLTRGGKEQTVSATLVEADVKPLNAFGYWEGAQPGQGQFFGGPKEWPADGQRLKDGNFSFGGDKRKDKDSSGSNQKVKVKTGDKTTMVYTDDEYQLIVTAPGGDSKERHLTAVDRKSGKTVFEGDITDESSRDKLPAPIAKRFKQLDQSGKLNAKGDKVDRQPGERIEKHFELKLDGPGKKATVKEGKDQDKNEDRDADDDESGNDDSDSQGAKPSASAGSTIGHDDVVRVYISDLQAPGVKTVKLARVQGGELSLPYVGKVKAEGLTESQLKRNIIKTYADANLLSNANVIVKRVGPGEADIELEEIRE